MLALLLLLLMSLLLSRCWFAKKDECLLKHRKLGSRFTCAWGLVSWELRSREGKRRRCPVCGFCLPSHLEMITQIPSQCIDAGMPRRAHAVLFRHPFSGQVSCRSFP
ncbi:uncharacterized protein TM35_000491070 [Trypanosoma theileri]|uniref:Secreted protein n=1 Tax=Trypanosoma theileri TaxID=67003 RepID=A0A1X0NHN1_9TRYP|nr:uncharacterized protein TM35_000491070 [Trypanosoma theileri]ORC84101.1 hypothetical protein TM35_000491070 [Trypanosoma theileri]